MQEGPTQGDYLTGSLENLWKELSANPHQISPDQLRKESEKLQTGLRKRSIIGGGAAFIVIAGWTIFFFVFHNTLMRIGSILTVAGAAYEVIQLLMRPARATPDLAGTACVTFYRAELKRQRDFHKGTWFWSRLLVFLPGPLLWYVGLANAFPQFALFIWLQLVVFLTLGAIAIPLNLRLARKYQRPIDALDLSLKNSN
jgi:hypothetical protein